MHDMVVAMLQRYGVSRTQQDIAASMLVPNACMHDECLMKMSSHLPKSSGRVQVLGQPKVNHLHAGV